MLTSPNQYLRPEYLTPLPTTLDAKKSPLALLAQTCSQIGADAPNAKLLQSSEKSSKSSKVEVSKDKNDTSHKSSFKLENHTSREKSKSPEERSSSSASTGTASARTPVNSKPMTNGRCSSTHSSSSPRASPATNIERKTPASAETISERTNSPEKANERTTPQTPSSSASKTAFTPNILTSSSDPAIKDLPLGTFKPGVPPTSSPFLGAYPTPAFPLSMDLMATGLMSQHHAALKAGGLPPYLGYGRMKQDSLGTVCRDPYCTGCSVSSHLNAVKCPAGCTQCDHAKTTQASYMSHSPAAAAYAHAQLAALAAASHLPYVCNWISGDAAYCGKRFSSSEELLTHLRTHTNGTVSEASSALSMLGQSALPPTHPLLHRTYPTPPLSPLATARYHPYSKPSLLHPSLGSSSLSGFPLGHPGLSPYLSPYSLYGPRLGTTPGMHP
nr:unnamed protein product [Callosobruchus chinensis]